MGADAGLDSGDSSLVTATPKVFQHGKFLIGVSGTSRVSQLIRHVFAPPEIKGDLAAYFVKDFCAALRECLKEHGGECKNSDSDGPETIMDGRCLVAIKGRIFCIDGSYSATEIATPYQAAGSGAVEARAAMFTAYQRLPKPISGELVVTCALEAAAELNREIRPPFTILSLEE